LLLRLLKEDAMSKNVISSILIDEQLHEKFKKKCKDEGMKQGWVIAQLIKKYVEGALSYGTRPKE
jgi:hypothetical protein